MFSVITNIYKKKTKGPALMELVTATEKLKKFLLTTRGVRCVHHRWHGAHQYDIQVLATYASACWHMCGQNLNVVLMCSVSPVVHTSNTSSCQKKLFQFFCGCEQFHVCNQGEHYETPCIIVLTKIMSTEFNYGSCVGTRSERAHLMFICRKEGNSFWLISSENRHHHDHELHSVLGWNVWPILYTHIVHLSTE
jgi:hypothetical protein